MKKYSLTYYTSSLKLDFNCIANSKHSAIKKMKKYYSGLILRKNKITIRKRKVKTFS